VWDSWDIFEPCAADGLYRRNTLLGLPKMWRKHQEIQGKRVATVSEIWRVLDKHLFPSKKGR
jgi:hypothetical protein